MLQGAFEIPQGLRRSGRTDGPICLLAGSTRLKTTPEPFQYLTQRNQDAVY